MIAEKEMLKVRSKSFQHRTGIALADGSEQGYHTPTNDCMVHTDLPIRDCYVRCYPEQK